MRASYLIAGALGCSIHVHWAPRRSSVESCIADDLTHSDFSSVKIFDPHAEMRYYEDFPGPISLWMQRAKADRWLGHKILEWMKKYYCDLL